MYRYACNARCLLLKNIPVLTMLVTEGMHKKAADYTLLRKTYSQTLARLLSSKAPFWWDVTECRRFSIQVWNPADKHESTEGPLRSTKSPLRSTKSCTFNPKQNVTQPSRLSLPAAPVSSSVSSHRLTTQCLLCNPRGYVLHSTCLPPWHLARTVRHGTWHAAPQVRNDIVLGVQATALLAI